ncbi:MAG: hypothetical protein JO347_04740, partial [Candidatus Eremiobacteraeota bacterium]|nr:hypothetical protein [Candidatus Eremiobacteraeota bacterium]
MPDQSAEGVPQVQVRDVLALLFAVLCGLLLGVAAAPSILPKLGFAVFTPYVVETRSRLQAEHQRAASAPTTNVATSASHPATARTQQSVQPRAAAHAPATRPVSKRVASTRLATLRAQVAADQPPP